MERHPTAAALEGLVYGGLPADRLRAVTAHILRGCRACGRLLTRLVLGGSSEIPLPPAADYDEAVDRAFATVRALLPRIAAFRSPEAKKREALALLASRGLEGLEAAPRDLQGLPVLEALLDRSRALRDENRDEMVELARCAAFLADRLSETEHGETQVADLRCRAWVELANAHRLAGELDLAEEALDRATSHFVLGSHDDVLGARFFSVLASQYAARRSFSMACSTLEVVAEIYRRHGHGHSAGRALILNGLFIGYEGDAETAIRLIQNGLSSVEEERDPGLVATTLRRQAWLLADCGRFREARRALWESRRRNPGAGGRLNELKVRWLEGRIFAGFGDLERAEQAWLQVKAGFEEAGLPFKAALAGLELGAVLLRQDRSEEATAIVLECTGVLFSLEIARKLLGSVFLLQEASKRGQLNLALLESVLVPLRALVREPAGLRPAAEA